MLHVTQPNPEPGLVPVSPPPLVDLSMTIQEGMQTFAAHWHPFVEITQLGRFGIEDRETRKLVLGTHTGTHLDAPRHFIPGGTTIERIPLAQINGPASVLDFSHLPDHAVIDTDVLKATLGDRPIIRLLCRFDWDVKALGHNHYYSHHPYFTQAACIWLVQQGCQLIALDTPQPDNPADCRGAELDAPNHKVLLGNNVMIGECLVNLRALTQPVVQLVFAPLKIMDADGAPSRVFAWDGVL
jgi:arylformamidase